MQKLMTICQGVCRNIELCSRHIDEILSDRPTTESSRFARLTKQVVMKQMVLSFVIMVTYMRLL